MNCMLREHAKVLQAIRLAGAISGRKKLQKMIYIAKQLSFPFDEKFQFHFYGPYSEELTVRVEELVNMGFLEETKIKKGGYVQYRYNLTEEGEGFLNMLHLENPPQLEACLQDMNNRSSRFLELVSTILFFQDLGKEEIIHKINTVKAKQKYTAEEIEEAFQYIDALKKQIF